MKTDERMDALLNCGNIIRGYVYKDGKRSEQWFEGTPENIASFLTQRGDADHMVLTDMMDMLINANVITEGSPNVVSRSGNTEENTMVTRKTAFTKISGAQPVVIFREAARHSGQTYRRK